MIQRVPARSGGTTLKFFLPVLLALSCVCAQAEDLRDVSMIQLIANPHSYEGKRIRLIAFLNLEFEGNALYLHREDFEHAIPNNAIWISLTDRQEQTSGKLSGGYVLVEGVFNAEDRGHFGMFSGSIEKVTRLSAWRNRPKRDIGTRSK